MLVIPIFFPINPDIFIYLLFNSFYSKTKGQNTFQP